MRARLSLIVLLFFTGVSFGQKDVLKPAAKETSADVTAAILKLEDAGHTARLSGDAAAFKSLYSDDFAGINAAGGKSDKTNIIEFYADDGAVMAVSATDDVQVRNLTNVAIVTARLKYQYNSKKENRAIRWLRYTRVYEKRSNGWQVVAEHFSFTDDPTKK